MPLSMNQLRAFYWVAKSQSLSKAANQLQVSQPSLSKQLQRLEQHYQITLFNRGRHGMTLTSDGQALYDQVRGLGQIEHKAEALLNQVQGRQRQVLRVGIGSAQVMMPVIGAFHHQYPDTELDVIVAGSEDLQHKLLEREFDIGILHTEQEFPEFRRLDLMPQSLELVLPIDHRLLQRPLNTLQDLLNERFIFRADGSKTQSLVNKWLWQQGITLEPLLSFNSQESQREAVAAGMGIAFVFQGETPPDSRLTTLSLSHLQPPSLCQSVIWSKAVSEQAVIQQFVQFMIHHYQQQHH
ncbi:LysR family transcriptional regulator [Oceanospirillum beijerinckii]|uniref:LysR family transcriptional regulator n=1 Tax=Oceanospirillum beijerinckii TaxID=64976 RepID=UPI0003FBF295|nr:LysR family transcriptional regulator [Oceanospirillum beijerinckii]